MFGWNSLSKGEKLDVGLLYGGAALLGGGSIFFRAQTVGTLSLELIRIQYGIAFLFLGTLLALKTRVRTTGGAFVSTGLFVALLIGLLVPAEAAEPIDVVMFALAGLLTFVIVLLHYRLNNPTNFHILALASIFGLQMWGFGVYYCVEALRAGRDIWFAGAAILITIMVLGYLRVLKREYEKSYIDIF